MKNVLYYIAGFAILVSMSFSAKAEYVDLRGGDITSHGICRHNDKGYYKCLEIKKNGKVYNLLYDANGEVAIYQIDGEKALFLWTRNSV